MDEFGKVVQLVQGGGNVALLVCVYFIFKAADRLSRIEAMLRFVLRDKDDDDTTRGFRDGD